MMCGVYSSSFPIQLTPFWHPKLSFVAQLFEDKVFVKVCFVFMKFNRSVQ